MLEIKNLVRVYKPKKGEPVKALDGVSLKFPDTGMIFLLGKSGSGKSTLLNLLGGLDKYDSGEIIIKDKSSKNFTQDDFDSYRNTYLGFIFQEYNILNEFSVGVNIGLALQLQGKKVTEDAVNKILAEVDLSGYADRKPTELSGGQKQRVAIARALVKNPQIILADEPTGALDSATGLQVFDTLKRLSKDKLVIVVTHDREFAELYGDRVIELKDGKVISDITKYKSAAQKASDGLSVTDDSVIQIKKGYRLTQEDLDIINNYLSERDAVITIDSKLNETVRKAAKLDESGQKESFKDTDNNAVISKDNQPFKLIKSRLPYKHSLKMGASSLKHKRIRLAITIFLSFIAFGMFGLADTVSSYDKVSTLSKSIQDTNVNYLSFSMEYNQTLNNSYYSSKISMTKEDIEKLNKDTGYNFKPVYNEQMGGAFFYNFKNQNLLTPYYISTVSGFYEVSNKEELEALGFTVIGKMPKENNEIAITRYIYSHYQKAGYMDDNNNSYSADKVDQEAKFLSLNPVITLNNRKYYITAVVDTNINYERYKYLDMDRNSMDIEDFVLISELQTITAYGYHSLAFVKEGFTDQFATADKNVVGLDISKLGYIYLTNKNQNYGLNPSRIATVSELVKHGSNFLYFDESDTTLGENDIIINLKDVFYYINDTEFNNLFYADANTILLDYANNNIDAAITNGFEYSDYENAAFEYYIYLYYTGYKKSNYGPSGEEIYKSIYFQQLDQYIKSNKNIKALFSTVNMQYLLNYPIYNMSPSLEINLKGFYLGEEKTNNVLCVSEKLFDLYNNSNQGEYAFAITIMPNDITELKKLSNFYYNQDKEGSSYVMQNEITVLLNMVNELFEGLAKIFLYVGLGLALFAALMLTNYISTSITYKKREIGILRAVGARSSDVFGIFFNESLIIAVINFILATIAVIIAIFAINEALRNNYGILITFLIFSIRQIALMLGVSLLVAFISSFLPVIRIARKRPVDAINNR